MSDTGRQDLTDKATSALKPESQKSVGEQVSDQAKSAYESAASTLQPSGEKSLGQQATDGLSGDGQDGKTVLQQVQETATSIGNTVSQTVTDAINSVSGSGGAGPNTGSSAPK